MKNFFFFTPAILGLFLYLALGLFGDFHAIDPLVWLWLSVLLVSAILMSKGRWYGCIGGMTVGFLLFYMGTKYTGQVINVEKPLGFLLVLYHLVCGIAVFKKCNHSF